MEPATHPCPLCGASAPVVFTVGIQPFYDCPECGLLHRDPAYHLGPEAERAHYEQHDNSPEDREYLNFLSRLWTPLSEKLSRGMSGLDYGSGPGPAMHMLAEADGMHLECYDPYFAPRIHNLNTQWDFITCSETAEHFREPDKEFLFLSRLLKPGAWLGVMTSLIDHADGPLEKWHYLTEPTHNVFYRRACFEWMAGGEAFNRPEFPARNIVLMQKPA